MKSLLLDLNVILDVLLDRAPNVEAAVALWSEVEAGRARGFLPAHGFTTIYYLLARARGAGFARMAVDRLLAVFGVARVDQAVLRRALVLAWADFEDAVCAAAAEVSGCDVIVTGNPRDYPDSPVAVMDAAGALIWLRN